MVTGEVGPGENRREGGGGGLIRGGSECGGGRGLMKEDWFHLGMEETDEGMRISCHNEEKVSVPKLALSLTPPSLPCP